MSATALVVLFVWWEVRLPGRGEWSSATTTSGEQSVMIAGIQGMLVLPADSLDSLHMARFLYLILSSDHALNRI